MSKIVIDTRHSIVYYRAMDFVRWVSHDLKFNPDLFIKEIAEFEVNDLIMMRAVVVLLFLQPDESLTRRQFNETLDLERNSKFIQRHVEPNLGEHTYFAKKTDSKHKRRVGRPKRGEEISRGRRPIAYSGDTTTIRGLSDPLNILLGFVKNAMIILKDNGLLKKGVTHFLRFNLGIIQSKDFPTFLEIIDRETLEIDKIGKRMMKYAPKTGQNLSNISEMWSEFYHSPDFTNHIREMENINIEQIFADDPSLEEKINKLTPESLIRETIEILHNLYISGQIPWEIDVNDLNR